MSQTDDILTTDVLWMILLVIYGPEHMNMTFDLELSPNFTHAQQTGDLLTLPYTGVDFVKVTRSFPSRCDKCQPIQN